jgi:hypothetical protein
MMSAFAVTYGYSWRNVEELLRSKVDDVLRKRVRRLSSMALSEELATTFVVVSTQHHTGNLRSMNEGWIGPTPRRQSCAVDR